jgi:hypothetical protein
MNLKGLIILVLLSSSLYLWGCSPYTQRGIPSETQIGARAFNDPNQARKFFGFDIRGTGLLPVEVIIDNKGFFPVKIIGAKTFLIGDLNIPWPLLEKGSVYERLSKSKDSVVSGSASAQGISGTEPGALIGAAIGIVNGPSTGQAAGKGAGWGDGSGTAKGNPCSPRFRNRRPRYFGSFEKPVS